MVLRIRDVSFESGESGREISDAVVAAKTAIEVDGAVILRKLVGPTEIRALKEALIRALHEDEIQRGREYRFRGMVHALMTRGEAFFGPLENPGLIGIAKAVLGHGCILHAYNSSSMPPGGSNYSRPIHVDCPRLIPGYITNLGATLALDGFTPENGAMEIAHGLKGQLNAPTEEEFEAAKLRLDDLKAGDAIFFNARCWHRGGINRTNTWRHAITLNFCRAYMRQQFDFSSMIEESRISRMSVQVRGLLGYFVRPPKTMDEFLSPPDQRKYRPGQE